MSVPQRLVALDFPTGLSLCPQNSPFQISPFKLYSHKTEPGEVLIDNSVAPLFWADGRERKCSKIYAVGHCWVRDVPQLWKESLFGNSKLGLHVDFTVLRQILKGPNETETPELAMCMGISLYNRPKWCWEKQVTLGSVLMWSFDWRFCIFQTQMNSDGKCHKHTSPANPRLGASTFVAWETHLHFGQVTTCKLPQLIGEPAPFLSQWEGHVMHDFGWLWISSPCGLALSHSWILLQCCT